MARAIFSGRHPSRLWPGPYFPAAIFRDYGPGHNFQAAILRDYGPGHIFRPPSFAIIARGIFSGRHLSRLWPGPRPSAVFRSDPWPGPPVVSFVSFISFKWGDDRPDRQGFASWQ